MRIKLSGNSGILDTTEDILDELRTVFSVENENPKAVINTRKYAITPLGRFEIGLWPDIQKYITEHFPIVDVTLDVDFQYALIPSIDIKNILNLEDRTYYDYQYDSIVKMFENGRGIIHIATSGGKSTIIGGFCKTILQEYPNFKIVILVPNTLLLNQLYDEFDKWNISTSKWSGKNELDTSKSVYILNFQMATSNIKNTLKYIKNCDCLLTDEIHKAKRKNSISKLINSVTTYNKFGFTGTLPEYKIDEWNILGKIGPILYKKTSKELRDDGKISDVNVQIVKLQHKDKPKKDYVSGRPNGDYIKEMDFLYNSDWRNNFICDVSERLNGNVLVLVNRIAHGELLEKMIKEKGFKDVTFIQGSTPDLDREKIKQLMESKNGVVCVAMDVIFSTGVSINNLPNVLFVCIGKSLVKIIQSIGRSLRLHKNKDAATIYDIADTTKYSLLHLEKRMKLYAQEEINYGIKKIKEQT